MRRYIYTLFAFICIKTSPTLLWRSFQIAALQDRNDWLKIKVRFTEAMNERTTARPAHGGGAET
jgi:hypothetical protein